MPYSVVSNHPECDGYAVVKDSNNEVIGCHRTETQANDQLTAVNISEYGDRALPKNYRPASSDDVPSGRNCGNCYFYANEYCSLWKAAVKPNYYCNRWAPMEARDDRQESYEPTEAMRREAQRGLDWRSEYGRGGTAVGIARARDIAGGKSLPLDTVLRMRSFFARHEVDKKAEGFRPGEDGYPSNGRIAWALWGGDAGKSFADKIAKQNEKRSDIALEILRNLLDL